jgi:hypothetical protein
MFALCVAGLLAVSPHRAAPHGNSLDSAVMIRERHQSDVNVGAAREELDALWHSLEAERRTLEAERRSLEAARAELAISRAELLEERRKVSLMQSDEDPVTKAFQDSLDRFHITPALVGALKLGIFERLNASDATFSELQRSLNVSSRGLDTLLDVCISAGLITYDQQSETFANHPTLKTTNLPMLKIALLGLAVSSQRQFYYVAESVRAGRAVGLTKVLGHFESLYEARAALPEVARDWDPWMQQLDGPQKFLQISKLLYGTPAVLERNGDLDAQSQTPVNNEAADPRDYMAGQGGLPFFHGKLLDWCGNTGGNAIRLAKRDPTLNITVLDLPAQCEKARDAITEVNLSHRIDTLPCDLLNQSFTIPGKYHGVMMVHTIREWSKAHVQHFFGLIFNALYPGGVVFMDMVSKRAEGKNFESVDKKPKWAPLYFLVSASQEEYKHTYPELIVMLKRAGFTLPEEQKPGYVVATKPIL